MGVHFKSCCLDLCITFHKALLLMYWLGQQRCVMGVNACDEITCQEIDLSLQRVIFEHLKSVVVM